MHVKFAHYHALNIILGWSNVAKHASLLLSGFNCYRKNNVTRSQVSLMSLNKVNLLILLN
jgi:hypothetical protein